MRSVYVRTRTRVNAFLPPPFSPQLTYVHAHNPLYLTLLRRCHDPALLFPQHLYQCLLQHVFDFAGGVQPDIHGRWLPVAGERRRLRQDDVDERDVLAAVVLHLRGDHLVHLLPSRQRKFRVHPERVLPFHERGNNATILTPPHNNAVFFVTCFPVPPENGTKSPVSWLNFPKEHRTFHNTK